MDIHISNHLWPIFAELLGLPKDEVIKAVITFEMDHAVKANIEMYTTSENGDLIIKDDCFVKELKKFKFIEIKE